MTSTAAESSPAELNTVALVCTLKGSPDKSSNDLMARRIFDRLAQHEIVDGPKCVAPRSAR